ncbi:MAG TPA: prepilin-type N-terminal cleavage/methylation domain-containing protein [Pyrinomonadaceae bacterium]
MKKSIMDKPMTHRKTRASRGFSLLELIVVMTVIAIVSGAAVLGISRSRNSINLQNSARLFGSYVEKARLDAIRRHDVTNIDITGPSTYTVTMAFDGTGTVGVRSFSLEKGIVFTDSTNTAYTVDGSGTVSSSNGEAVSWADFNWRGRTSQCSMFFRMQNANTERSSVQVAGSGDVTIDTGVYTPAAVTTTNVNATADVTTSAVVNGTFSHFELNPCSVSGGGGSYIAPPLGTCAGGSIGSNIGSLTIRKNGASTASVNISVTGPGTITAAPNSNLQVTPTSQNVTSSTGGTVTFTIKSITKTRASNPPFTVAFSNPCSSLTIYVTVTN